MDKRYALKYSNIAGALIAASELTKNFNKKMQKKIPVTGLVLFSTCLSFPSLSAIVRSDIPYQTFRDFAENKGSFIPGATNLEIYDKQGNHLGTLDKAPMIDFSSATIATGILPPGDHTLYSPQYVVTAKHVNGSDTMSFGYKNNIYTAVGTNKSGNLDLQTRRLSKIVTEVAPAELSDIGDVNGGYRSDGRFSEFYRLGGGQQFTKDKNGKLYHVATRGSFLTGGTVGGLEPYNNGKMITAPSANIYSTSQGMLANYLIMGDSGSPLFAYDTLYKKWVLIGVTSTRTISGNSWVVTSENILNQQPKNDFDKIINYRPGKGILKWQYDSINSVGFLTQGNIVFDMHGKNNNNPNAGKNLLFTGDNGEIVLFDSVNQGAGYLEFANNYNVSPVRNQTWVGGGIITDNDAHVVWQVNGVEGDNLHKLGKGTLTINGTGTNLGGLNAGDGTVILNQRKDTKGNVQAFNSVNISSGRPTVILSDDKQVNPDRISWGYRGGTLDLNGNNLSFTRLQAADYGAIIANYNNKSMLNLNILKDSDISVPVKEINIFGEEKASPGDLYYDRGRGRYLILKSNAYAPLFQDLNNLDIWQNIGADRNKALEIAKSQKIESSSRPYIYHGQLNGNMDVNIQQASGKDTFSIDGSVYLPDGTVTKKAGVLIFQGHPVIHAGQTVSAEQDDWENRHFILGTLKLDGSDFHLSRNAIMNANIRATNASTIILGSDTVYTDSNDGTGDSVEPVAGTSSVRNEQDISKFSGEITADNSTVTINNKFDGGFSAINKSVFNIKSQQAVISMWSDITEDSKLILQKDSKLTVDINNLVNKGILEIGENASLRLQGYPVFDAFVPTLHELGNVNMTGTGSKLEADNYTMFSGDIKADEDSAVKLKLGSEETKLSEYDPSPALSSVMFGDYNTSWNGSVSALRGDASMVNTVWRMTDNSRLNSLIINKSLTVFSSNNDKFSTLTVNELTTNGSTFVLRSNATTSDKLIVNNKLEGKHNNLLVDYVAKDGKEKKLNLDLVSAPKGTSTDVFNPQTQNVGFSDITPIIEENSNGEKVIWTLKGFKVVANQQSVQKAEHFMSADYKNFLAEVNNLNKRMGDLHDINGEAGAWARIMSGTGSAGGGFSDNYTHVQVGADKKHELDGLNLFTGVTMTYTNSNVGSDSFSGKTKSVGAGLYASAMFDSGAYIDLIGKYVHHDNEYTATFAGLGTKDYRSHSWYAGTEMGYRCYITEDAWIEPQVELVYGSISGKQFTWNDQGMSLLMKGKDYNPLIGRTGMDVGKSFSGKDWRVTARAGLGYQFDLLTNRNTRLRDASGEKRIKGEKDERMLMSVGLNAEVHNNIHAGLGVEKSAFGKYNIDNAINANFRYSF
ncbi:autotransporter outer membrane beta-barrel domain-containing protein [Escherichia coli]|uniref:S6 family peptidase n=1 Tax=Escherichia coli TaxID=562 RepID=UPI0029F990CD|nr:autotransporter outer membrane beta-barrel domain-containing protein [Escherichia coli]HCP8973619.1 autotransporter outer membrane beta-barrel domain-containing protein [Escherichia coli]